MFVRFVVRSSVAFDCSRLLIPTNHFRGFKMMMMMMMMMIIISSSSSSEELIA
jgi:hypothetical protein